MAERPERAMATRVAWPQGEKQSPGLAGAWGNRMGARPARLVPLVVAALVLTALAPVASAAKPQPGGKAYSATATPQVIALPAGSADVASLSLRNCGCTGVAASGQPFASAQLRVLKTEGLDLSNASVSRTGWTVRPAAEVGDDVVVELVSSGPGTTNAVPPGEALVVTVPVKATAGQGAVTIRSAVKQSNDFSGVGNDFVQVGTDPVVYLGAGPADHLVWDVQPSTVQVSSSQAVAGAGVTPVVSMCPAPQARVVDAQGRTVTATRTVSLSPIGTTLALGGTTSTATVGGVATFGSCASGVTSSTLGRGFQVSASASGLTPASSTTFSVLPTYGTCAATCSVTGAVGAHNTGAAVQADPATDAGAADRLSFGVGVDPWSAADLVACDPDPESSGRANPYRDPVSVELAHHDKTVTLRWTKQAVQWATNNGSAQWRVCLAAAASFTGSVQVGSWWVGPLQACRAVPVGDPCVADLRRNGGEQFATVRVPDRPGDPRMI
ncbi:MAG: hypothetical protein JWO27_1096 [Frankiales bacterium]|nr:hypothetical protein [Frankiales bacterium]